MQSRQLTEYQRMNMWFALNDYLARRVLPCSQGQVRGSRKRNTAVQNMDWTGQLDWTGVLDWTIEAGLDWIVGPGGTSTVWFFSF